MDLLVPGFCARARLFAFLSYFGRTFLRTADRVAG
jgi:hypothetical protein